MRRYFCSDAQLHIRSDFNDCFDILFFDVFCKKVGEFLHGLGVLLLFLWLRVVFCRGGVCCATDLASPRLLPLVVHECALSACKEFQSNSCTRMSHSLCRKQCFRALLLILQGGIVLSLRRFCSLKRLLGKSFSEATAVFLSCEFCVARGLLPPRLLSCSKAVAILHLPKNPLKHCLFKPTSNS